MSKWQLSHAFNFQPDVVFHLVFFSLLYPQNFCWSWGIFLLFSFLCSLSFTSFRMKEPKSTFEVKWEGNLRNKESLLCFGSKMIFSTSDLPLSLLPSYLSSHFLSCVRVRPLLLLHVFSGDEDVSLLSLSFSAKKENDHDVHSSSLFPSSIHLFNNKEWSTKRG